MGQRHNFFSLARGFRCHRCSRHCSSRPECDGRPLNRQPIPSTAHDRLKTVSSCVKSPTKICSEPPLPTHTKNGTKQRHTTPPQARQLEDQPHPGLSPPRSPSRDPQAAGAAPCASLPPKTANKIVHAFYLYTTPTRESIPGKVLLRPSRELHAQGLPRKTRFHPCVTSARRQELQMLRLLDHYCARAWGGGVWALIHITAHPPGAFKFTTTVTVDRPITIVAQRSRVQDP